MIYYIRITLINFSGMAQLQCIFDSYVYYNEQNGYSVIKLEEGITAVGNLPPLNKGDHLLLEGEFIFHQRFGEQFKINSYAFGMPITEGDIIKYLGSRILTGIGERMAERIYAKFGDATMDILDKNIDRLLEVEGIGKKKLKAIKEDWQKQKSIRDVMLFLQSHGITPAYAHKIYTAYGDKTIEVVSQNPYRLADDIWGIGFKIADEVGRSFGVQDYDPNRMKAGLIHILKEAAGKGNVYLPSLQLTQAASEMLRVHISPDTNILHEMFEAKEIVVKDDRVYIPTLYFAERSIERKLKSLSSQPAKMTNDGIDKLNLFSKMFSEEQLGAIKSSLIHHIMILTGGPGTGKTTTLRGIINAYKKLEKKIALAAPTGRAAKRMADVIGLEARTIHRLLEFVPSLGYFAVNADNPLQIDLLVIDEISMIDTFLMNSLLDAVPDETTVVFVGDADQLPSIGPGNILNDMISSKKIPTFRLTKIYRQEEASEIILAAHKINQGEILRIINREESDLFFIEETDSAEIPGTILSLCSNRIPSKYNFNPFSDIQVITPMYKGDAGADNLNELLQHGLNENPPLHKHAGKKFKIGDKVMQLRNNYEKYVFNGDIGIIEDINNHSKVMAVNYAGKVVEYSFTELDEITLAYAITVHKSQGSEYPCIILPLTTSHYPLLQRNLLYTAITRASKLMIIIGSKQAMAMAIKNNRVVQRYTSLFKKFESFD